MPSLMFNSIKSEIDLWNPYTIKGKITEVLGIIAKGIIPGVHIGDRCEIVKSNGEKLPAEVVGFKNNKVIIMPFGNFNGVGPDSDIISTGKCFHVNCGDYLRGSILNGLGLPITLSRKIHQDFPLQKKYIDANPPSPLSRKPVCIPLSLGIRALDGLCPIGTGQRIGIFAAAGTGKSTLLGVIARNANVDINIVALIGERGREVNDFINENVGEQAMEKSIVVVATSDEPALVRLKAAFVATAIAEYFRDQNLNVLLMMDSITRFARAQREIGLAIGEPPTRGGYTPSVFSILPKLLERTGNSEKGSITAIYTVLVAGDDITEPIADEVISILDGHILLSRQLASQGHYPAIDILSSKSRLSKNLISPEHHAAISLFLELYSIYQQNIDSINYNFYQIGQNKTLDIAIANIEAMKNYLLQTDYCNQTFEKSKHQLLSLVNSIHKNGY